MTDRPYTDNDLRTEAARQVKHILGNADTDGLLETSTHTLAEGQVWEQLEEGDWQAALREVDELVENAADVSEWAINLGADGLEPGDEHVITLNADSGSEERPIARIHFAFEPGMPAEMRTALVEGIGQAMNAYL